MSEEIQKYKKPWEIVVDDTMKRVQGLQRAGQIDIPPNYSVSNALQAAYLVLQETMTKDGKPVLTECTPVSIANALLDMVVQGLDPGKKQVYFIAYGKKLTAMRSRFGTEHLVRQKAGAKDIWYGVIYGGDEFKYTIHRGKVQPPIHIQEFININPENIMGAYCCIEFGDDLIHTEIMTMAQIRQSWKASKMNPDGKDSTHSKYPDQMALRTVINRACKPFINAANDSNLFIQAVNRGDEVQLENDVEENANQDLIDIDDVVDEETGEIVDAGKQEEFDDIPMGDPPVEENGQKTMGPDF